MFYQLRRCIAIATMLYLVQGCSSVRDISDRQYNYNNEHSLAWNISRASGMNPFYDAQVTSTEKALYSRTDFDLTFPPTGDNKLNESKLTLNPLLQYPAVGFKLEDWQRNGILAWIPSELATTPAMASKVLAETLQKAVQGTLRETKRPQKAAYTGRKENDWLGTYIFQETPWTYFSVQFEDTNAGCKIPTDKYFNPQQLKRSACVFATTFHDPERIVSTPSFIGHNSSGKSYLVRLDGINGSHLSPVYQRVSLHSKSYSTRLDYAFLQQVSIRLPTWVIIHIAQHEDSAMPAVLLQEGRVHFFMRDKAK